MSHTQSTTDILFYQKLYKAVKQHEHADKFMHIVKEMEDFMCLKSPESWTIFYVLEIAKPENYDDFMASLPNSKQYGHDIYTLFFKMIRNFISTQSTILEIPAPKLQSPTYYHGTYAFSHHIYEFDQKKINKKKKSKNKQTEMDHQKSQTKHISLYIYVYSYYSA